MDIPELKAFVEISKRESFTRAAEALHITQPAISKRIRTLESNLGVSLFERIPKKALLTYEGQCLLPMAIEIIQNIRSAEQKITNLKETVSGSIKLISSHHIGLHHLPPILKNFNHHYPHVELNLSFMESELAYKALSHHDADLAFITTSTEERLGFIHHLRWPDPMVAVTSINHPLRQHKTVTLDALAEYRAILPSRNTFTYNIVERLFMLNNIVLKVDMPTNYLETIKMMVAAGLGWSVLPKTMMDDQLNPITIKDADNKVIQLSRELGAISLSSNTLSSACKALLALA
jgi:DNA-binding transcriptional LysR family regulator